MDGFARTIRIDPLEPAVRPLINNLYAHYGDDLPEVLDLRSRIVQKPTPPIIVEPNDEPEEIPATLGSRLTTTFRFALTTGTVFALLFVGLNWSAYKQKAEYWYQSVNPNAVQTQEQQLLASLLESKEQKSQALAHETIERDINPDDIKERINVESLTIAPPKTYLIIPKLSMSVPVQFPDNELLLKEDWTGLEAQIQDDLRHGVVHYPGTADPGEEGNVFITGHSSYYPWDDGRYKDVFANLSELKVGDKIVVQHNGVDFTYQAFDIQTVKPSDTHVLAQIGNEHPSMLTLMTCTPVGTTLNRLVVRFKQISPEPSRNRPMEGDVVIGGVLNA